MRTNETYDKLTAIPHGMHKVDRSIRWSTTCYGCRPKDEGGMFIRAYYTTDDYCVGIARTDAVKNGFPGVQHGGVVGTYLDEVLWRQTRREDPRVDAMTVETQINYWAPVPEDTDLKIVALPAEVDGRHYYVEGGIFLPDGKIAATAKIHYICLKIDSELSEEEQNRDTKPVETELEEVYF